MIYEIRGLRLKSDVKKPFFGRFEATPTRLPPPSTGHAVSYFHLGKQPDQEAIPPFPAGKAVLAAARCLGI